jgi:hypothetical protein
MNEDHKPKLDGSINIPTLVTLVGLLVAQGLLPSGDSKAIAEEAVGVHAQVLHDGSVPLQTYELEKAHDRETMARIEGKLDDVAKEVSALAK